VYDGVLRRVKTMKGLDLFRRRRLVDVQAAQTGLRIAEHLQVKGFWQRPNGRPGEKVGRHGSGILS
jgi:hypothetical protein